MEQLLLTKDQIIVLWTVLQPAFGILASIIAWLAKRAIERSEKTTQHLSDTVDSIRRDFSEASVRIAVAGQTLVDHAKHDDIRFDHLSVRVEHLERALGGTHS